MVVQWNFQARHGPVLVDFDWAGQAGQAIEAPAPAWQLPAGQRNNLADFHTRDEAGSGSRARSERCQIKLVLLI
jgi:hypothetical protein